MELYLDFKGRTREVYMEDVRKCLFYIMNYAFRGGNVGHRNCWGAALHMDQALHANNELSQKEACLYAVRHLNVVRDVDVFPQKDIDAFIRFK